jgi:hypothetical protein
LTNDLPISRRNQRVAVLPRLQQVRENFSDDIGPSLPASVSANRALCELQELPEKADLTFKTRPVPSPELCQKRRRLYRLGESRLDSVGTRESVLNPRESCFDLS